MTDRQRTRGTAALRRLGVVVGATVLVGAGLAAAAPASSAVTIVCPSNVNTFVWDGSANDTPGHVGDNVSWGDAYNWDQDCTPGLREQPHDDVVTIPSTAKVTISDGGSADLAALTNNGQITVTPGGALVTYGTSTSKTLILHGILGGTGRFTVTGTLTWNATSQGAAQMTTRRCNLESCASPAPVVGTTVIAAGAKLVINGRGVNLSDQRVIENHGTTTISGNGYIAADYGTAFRNLRAAGAVQPKFVFANDGGYYQGFAIAGFDRSAFSNSGLVNKSAGTGVSVIDAVFTSSDPGSTFTGVQQVKSGTLTIVTPDVTVRTAKVKQGATFGNGGPASCDPVNDPASCHVAEPTSDDPEVASVQLTKAGTTSSNVTIQEVSGVPPVTGQYGVPVRIETPNAQADATAPLRFRILLDASLLQAGQTATNVAATATVERQATNPGPYAVLPDCDSSGNPSVANPSCVARALSVSETMALGTGDVVIVVSSLVNSRYRISKVGA